MNVPADPLKFVPPLLLAVHGVLGVWGVIGLAEWVSSSTPWPRVSNPLFPREILLMQWVLVLLAAFTFVIGYRTQWPFTPVAMACIYAAMAALCAVQTMRYLVHDARFVAMGVEYLAYTLILIFLFRSELFRETATAVP